MRWMIFIIMLITISGCTDWKSRYWQAQLELTRLRQNSSNTKVETDTVTITEYPAIWDTLPIVVPDTAIRVFDKHEVRTPAPLIKYTRREVLRKDSVTIWLRFDADLQDGEVYSRIVIDSVQYPRLTQTVYKTVPAPLPTNAKSYPMELIAIGVMGLFLVYLLLRIFKTIIP